MAGANWFLNTNLKLKITHLYISIKDRHGAEEEEEIQEEEEERVWPTSVPDSNLWGPRCCDSQGWALYKTSLNGDSKWCDGFNYQYDDICPNFKSSKSYKSAPPRKHYWYHNL